MRKKANSIIFTILAATIVTFPHAPKIVPVGTLLTATAIAIVVSIPPNCEASIMEQLCSSVSSFLEDEGRFPKIVERI